MAEIDELLVEKIHKWKKRMEDKEFGVNLGKTKVVKCEARFWINRELRKVA